jgi:hypothetical protein
MPKASRLSLLALRGILRAGGMTQVVTHLPSKCESLTSAPLPQKKKKKKWGRVFRLIF